MMIEDTQSPEHVRKVLHSITRMEALGFHLFPLGVRSKTPRDRGWQTADYAGFDWSRHVKAGGNYGVRTGNGLLVLDIDPRHGGEVSLATLEWDNSLPDLRANFPHVRTGSGWHVYLKVPPGSRLQWQLPHYPGIDVQGAGRFVVGPGSVHPETGKVYRKGGDWGLSIPEAPPALLRAIARPKPPERKGTGGGQITPEALKALLDVLDPAEFGAGGQHHGDWVSVAMASHAVTDGDGREVWLDWCARDPQYGDGAREQNAYRWDSFDAEHKSGVSGATLYRAVSRAGHPELVAQADRTSAAEDFEALLDEEPETGPTSSHVAGLTYIRASDVEQKPIQWLWPNRVALGKLTGIAGPPDQGKSQVTASIAAAVTTGGVFPDGSLAPRGDVIFMSAEDDPSDTTTPRLEAAGANLDRVYFVNVLVATKNGKRMFSFKDDLPRLRKLVESKPEAKLIIVDPVSAYMGTGEVDTFKNSDVRGVLAPLGELATEFGVAVLFVTHFNKSGSGSAINRVTDSLAFTALSRSFWAVVPEVGADGGLTERKLMVRIKQNIAAPTAGLAYRIKGVTLRNGINTSHVVWDGEVNMTADEVLSAKSAADDAPKAYAARQFVMKELARGPMESSLLQDSALVEGINSRTLRRAMEELDVRKYQEGGKWWCEIEI